MSNIQETCDAAELGSRTNANQDQCKQFCNRNNHCNFVFLTSAKHCLMYETCDEKRDTTYVGTTYGKSVCPGKLIYAAKYTLCNIHVIFLLQITLIHELYYWYYYLM